MTAASPASSGGGWFSKLVVVVMLALAIGLYLWIVMVDRERDVNQQTPQASMRIIEGDRAGIQATATPGSSGLQNLPEDQLQVILRVFAPEMLQ